MDPSTLIDDIESSFSGGRAEAVAAAAAAGDVYVRLSSSSSSSKSNNAHERRGIWRNLRSSAFLTICCVVALLFGVLSLYTVVMKPMVDGGLVVLPKVPLLFGAMPTFLGASAGLRERTDSEVAQDPHRPSYHYLPARNWMGDMNALFYYKGYYHFFYQYNVNGSRWGHITWGHTVSKDLIHWLYLDWAITGDHWYDVNGTFSGSGGIIDNKPMILYTGGADNLEAEQSQCIAFAKDPSDPFLRSWEKFDKNPILTRPEGIGMRDFRDPSTPWQLKDSSWMFIVGAVNQRFRQGMSLLYKSNKDLTHWERQDHVLHTLNGTGMWEMQDFFSVDYETGEPSSKYVLKVSLIDEWHDYYTIGTYDEDALRFYPDYPELDIGSGYRHDYGKFYAAKSFLDPKKNRRIMVAWVNESDSLEADDAKGWACLIGIPRTLALDSKTGSNLLQWPIEEVESLRGSKVSVTDVKLEAGAVSKVEAVHGRQLDVEVTFKYPNLPTAGSAGKFDPFDCTQGGSSHRGVFGPFGLLVLADEDFQEQVAVFFYIAYKGNNTWTTYFCSDQSRSSLTEDVDRTEYGHSVPVLATEDTLSVRVLVDRTIVESFAQGGRVTTTARAYPTVAVEEKANLYIFNNGSTPISVQRLDAYQMKNVVLHPA